MKIKEIQKEINRIDLYLLDQILKERYVPGETILDAGCGSGRNLTHFIDDDFVVCAVDKDLQVIEELKGKYSAKNNVQFQISELESLPFEDSFFDHIICNAVLHFAKSTSHFYQMINELVRVLKPGGSLFIRMTSDFGIEDKVESLSDGDYKIPDGTTRFLLTEDVLKSLITNANLAFLEPLKTVNVNSVRCMSNLILQKM